MLPSILHSLTLCLSLNPKTNWTKESSSTPFLSFPSYISYPLFLAWLTQLSFFPFTYFKQNPNHFPSAAFCFLSSYFLSFFHFLSSPSFIFFAFPLLRHNYSSQFSP
ncbi:MAG: hypothetical protein JOS17DRAFT_561074 [Linnemannia elongata]|nr:MAG: hypothetical protein JOS17DRAFT_561074 [Linnemannia elongata]